MPHLLIIDAMNLIRRVHAAHGDAPANPSAALQSSLNNTQSVCRKLLKQFKPSHVIAVFDSDRAADAPRGWRSALYPEYKAGRKPMPPELKAGLTALQDSFWACGVDALCSASDEADDLIATLANKMAAHGHRATIISTDKGFCQLLSQPQIQIYDYFNKRALDAAFVAQNFGVTPAQLVDFWALTGVSGSHIKGVVGIGPKTAAELLNQFTSLTALLSAHARGDTAPAAMKKLNGQAPAAQLAQQLVRLRTDIALGFNLQALRYPPPPADAPPTK
ncbi:MAG: flap endonuclease Xni [Aeromonas sp.]